MRLHSISLLAIVLWPFGVCIAESTSGANISFPLIGVVFDSELRALRRVSGIPGAALLGAAIEIGFPIASAGIARESILVSSAADGTVRLLRIDANRVTTQFIDDVIGVPDRITASPSGRAAVLSSGGLLQVISGLPDAPVSSRQFSIPGAGDFITAAVSDDGRFVLCIAAESRGGGVWRLNVDEGTSETVLQAATTAIAFQPGSRNGIAVSAVGELYQLPISSEIRKFGPLIQSGTPIGVQVNTDGGHAYVAYSDGVLAVIDVTSGAANTVSCGCTPSAFIAMNSSSLFRINDPSAGTLILFDTSRAEPRTWFVPPDKVSQDRPENEQ
jgi:hypothetical protein